MNDNRPGRDIEFRMALRQLEAAERALVEARRSLQLISDQDAATTRTGSIVADPKPASVAQSSYPLPARSPFPAASVPAPPPTAASQVRGPYPGPPRLPQSALQSSAQPVGATGAKKAAKPPVPTETKIIRVIAVAGGIITVLGVGFFIALAIQIGLLGPLGRVLLATAVAIALFVIAWRLLNLEEKKSLKSKAAAAGEATAVHSPSVSETPAPSGGVLAGISALFATSYVIGGMTIWSLDHWLGWVHPLVCALGFAVLTLGFIAVVRLRQLSAVGMLIGIALVPFIGAYGDSWYSAFMLLGLLPPALFAATWRWPDTKTRLSAAAASVLAALILSVTWNGGISGILHASVTITAALTLSAVTLLSRSPKTAQDRFTGLVAPLLLLAAAPSTVNHSLALWLIVPAALILSVLGYRYAKEGMTIAGPLGLSATAVAFLLAWHITPPLGAGEQVDNTIVVVFFLLSAIAALFWLHHSEEQRIWPWGFWAGAVLIITGILSDSVLFGTPVWLTDFSALLQALLLIAVLSVAIYLRDAVASFPLWAKIIWAVVGLHVSMVALVTTFTFLGQLLGGSSGMWWGYLSGHATTSVLWIGLAAWMLIGQPKIAPRAALGTGVVLAIAGVAKLVFFDLGNLEGLSRAIAFLFSGIALLAIAIMGARKNSAINAAENAAASAPSSASAATSTQNQQLSQQASPYPYSQGYPPASDQGNTSERN